MTPYKHAVSSANKFGGEPLEYMEIHNWLDSTKEYTGDWTHRALRHHAAGVQEAVRRFGDVRTVGDGIKAPVKEIVERHIIEDCGYIPTVQDWLAPLHDHPEPWMLRVEKKSTTQPLIICNE